MNPQYALIQLVTPNLICLSDLPLQAKSPYHLFPKLYIVDVVSWLRGMQILRDFFPAQMD